MNNQELKRVGLITVLNSLLPVKYKIANAYSFGDVYKKSTLLAGESGNIFTMVKLFTLPFDKYFNYDFIFN